MNHTLCAGPRNRVDRAPTVEAASVGRAIEDGSDLREAGGWAAAVAPSLETMENRFDAFRCNREHSTLAAGTTGVGRAVELTALGRQCCQRALAVRRAGKTVENALV